MSLDLLDAQSGIKRFRKEIHHLAVCGCAGLIILSDFALRSSMSSGLLAHLGIRSPLAALEVLLLLLE